MTSESDARALLSSMHANTGWSSRADELTSASPPRAGVGWRSIDVDDDHGPHVTLECLDVPSDTRGTRHLRTSRETNGDEPVSSTDREAPPALIRDEDDADHHSRHAEHDDPRVATVDGETWAMDRGRARRGMSNRYAQMRKRAAIGASAHEPLDAPRVPVVAERIDGLPRAAAWFMENFALAKVGASSGIKLGTVRNVSTPHMRSASIQPFTKTIGHPTSWSRVTPSRLAVLSSHSPTVGPPRSDRCSAGCSPSEDQGGPP
jgi:hypothetical protein